MDQKNDNASLVDAASLPSAEAPLLTPTEAATYLKITRSKLERMRMRGDGPRYLKLGHKTVRYAPRILYVWLARQECSSTAG